MEPHLESALSVIKRTLDSMNDDLIGSSRESRYHVLGSSLWLAKAERDADFSSALLGLFRNWLDDDVE